MKDAMQVARDPGYPNQPVPIQPIRQVVEGADPGAVYIRDSSEVKVDVRARCRGCLLKGPDKIADILVVDLAFDDE